MSASQRNSEDEIIEGVGVTRKQLRIAAEERRERLEKNRPDPIESRTRKEKLMAEMENLKRGRNISEQKYISVQDALKDILDPIVKVYVDELGAKAYLIINEENIAKQTTEDWLIQYAARPLYNRGIFIKNKDLREHIRTWSDRAEKLQKIPSSFTLSEDELTFCRIKLSLEEGQTPTWDSFVSRCGSNGEALMAFLWSLLNKEDKSQQYLLIKGDGEDGKGSLVRWLNKLFNDQLVGLSVSDKWPALCVGRRVGVFNDINNTAIIIELFF